MEFVPSTLPIPMLRIGSYECPPEVGFSFCQQNLETPENVTCDYHSNIPNFVPGYESSDSTSSNSKVTNDSTAVVTEIHMRQGTATG